MFYFEKINDKTVMKSDVLDGLTHFFTTRETCIKTKDETFFDVVEDNKKMFCQILGIDCNDLISPNQTHSDNVQIAEVGKSDYPETDAVILTNKTQALFLNFADCTPVVVYDKAQNIVAIAHAGWKGTVAKIAVKTVEKMVVECGSKIEDLSAVVGTAIGMCCYNVGEEVLAQLKATVEDFSGLSKIVDDKIFVDLKNINRRQLEEIGVTEIDVSPYCTSCDNDLFFSYRKENGTTNRHSVIVKLNG